MRGCRQSSAELAAHVSSSTLSAHQMARAGDALQGSEGLQGVLPGQSSTRGGRISDAAARWQAGTLGRSSGPGVPASSSSKDAATKAKRAALRTLCTGCIQTPLGKKSCSSSMLAEKMPETWLWCGTNLDYGVLAVLMAQTAARTTRRRRLRGQRHGVRLASSCCFEARVVRPNAVIFLVRPPWGATWSELGFFWLLCGENDMVWLGFFWLLRGERGAGKCHLLSGAHSH